MTFTVTNAEELVDEVKNNKVLERKWSKISFFGKETLGWRLCADGSWGNGFTEAMLMIEGKKQE